MRNWRKLATLLSAVADQKVIFLEILFSGFIINLTVLAIPLLLQVILDKVLPYHALSTLNVVSFCIILVVALESFLGFIRGQLITYLSARMDITLALNVFEKLIFLPLFFFSKNQSRNIIRDILTD